MIYLEAGSCDFRRSPTPGRPRSGHGKGRARAPEKMRRATIGSSADKLEEGRRNLHCSALTTRLQGDAGGHTKINVKNEPKLITVSRAIYLSPQHTQQAVGTLLGL